VDAILDSATEDDDRIKTLCISVWTLLSGLSTLFQDRGDTILYANLARNISSTRYTKVWSSLSIMCNLYSKEMEWVSDFAHSDLKRPAHICSLVLQDWEFSGFAPLKPAIGDTVSPYTQYERQQVEKICESFVSGLDIDGSQNGLDVWQHKVISSAIIFARLKLCFFYNEIGGFSYRCTAADQDDERIQSYLEDSESASDFFDESSSDFSDVDINECDEKLRDMLVRKRELKEKIAASTLSSSSVPTIRPQKTYVVFDTNLYVHKLASIKDVVDAGILIVVVPAIVITELKGISQNLPDAKDALDYLTSQLSTNKRMVKVITSRGTMLKDISIRSEEWSAGSSADDIILSSCTALQQIDAGFIVLLMTNDKNMKIKAMGLSIFVVDRFNLLHTADTPLNITNSQDSCVIHHAKTHHKTDKNSDRISRVCT